VLYLAEVIQKKGGIIGGGKSELKLLACQRSEQNWTAVAGEDVVASEEASRFSSGTLVMVDLTANKQVQRLQEAGRPLVSILQNFSRLQEKFKNQEDEIEQWKQSLTYQSQELNRREMEMEARREQLQQMEEDFEQLEQQRQQFELTRGEVTQQQEDAVRNRQDLEQAWEHLRGETRRLEERQSELQQSSVLDDQQAQVIRDLLDRLTHSGVSASPVQDQLTHANALLSQHQDILTVHWQTVERQRQTSQTLAEEVDRSGADLHRRWQEWHQAQEALDQAKAELKLQQNSLQMKEEYAQLLQLQIQTYEAMYQEVEQLADGVGEDIGTGQVDVGALERMAIDGLQSLAQSLERDMQKSLQFVNGQEEELTLKAKELDGLRVKIQQASEFDRLTLESELADEQDAYQFLNETLVGQRRSLKKQESILRQHQIVLARRQGKPLPPKEGLLDFSQVLAQMESQKQQQADELTRIESQLDQLRASIPQTQNLVDQQTHQQSTIQNDLKQLEESLQVRRTESAQLMGKLELYQELLQPIQDASDALRQRIAEIAEALSQIQSSSDTQQQTVGEMRQVLTNLTNAPELAVS
jgi:chromosome segregation ATPase